MRYNIAHCTFMMRIARYTRSGIMYEGPHIFGMTLFRQYIRVQACCFWLFHKLPNYIVTGSMNPVCTEVL